ncbi:MAG: FadR/GntR family transcriptional regulator [Limnochordia bacterium]|nr:FadR/GntR family transcriptional regulator [Limnochordia bacterium]
MLETFAVEKRPLYEQVAEQLRKFIIHQNLQPGDRLPSEEDLASIFGVGRSSVREAVKSLSVLGIVDARRREGTIVKNVDPTQFIENIAYGLCFSPEGLQELHHLRSIMELGLIQYIGSNESLRARTVKQLKKNLDEMETIIDDDHEFGVVDLKFHETFFRCVNSEVIEMFASVVNDFFVHSQSLYGLSYAGNKQTRILNEHRRITEALEKGDLLEATQALTTHFSWFNKELVKEYAQSENNKDCC